MSKAFWSIKRYLVEIKIGSFFLAALVLLFITLISIRELTFFKGTYVLTVKFNFAEGLRPSSPVRFCGVDVGEVIREENNRPIVYVHVKIQNGIRIPRNSYFFINSLSLFGEKYLEITPPQEITGYLSFNETIEGLSPIPLFNVFVTFNKTMKEISDFVREGEIKTSLENSMNNIESITLKLDSIMTNMKNKEGTIGRLLYDDSLYKRVEEFIEDLKNNPWKLLHKPKSK
jgi:phospholipid/cholesterol/gamma-HCH transport system substrate-binding protein